MNKLGSHYYDPGYMDALASGDSPLHRLDPRAALITTLAFMLAVVSSGKYVFSALLPLAVFPVFQVALSGLPARYLLKKVLLVAPFAVLVGMFNPLLDRDVMVRIGNFGVSGGFISFGAIMLRFALTVSAALILVCTIGFNRLCLALEKLGVPRPFVLQLMFLYRYLFVLTGEAARMVRGIALRSCGHRLSLKTFASVAGHLLLRTLDRAQRINLAMRCRGFDGTVRTPSPLRFRFADGAYAACWIAVFFVLRRFDVASLAGALLLEVLP